MNRNSTVTTRGSALAAVATASAGGLKIHAETVTHETAGRIELSDLTSRVDAVVRQSGIREGMVHVWSMHTTCALMVNEFQQALLADISRVIQEIVKRDGGWMHNDPVYSDCDRANADAHLRAMLLGHSLTLQVSGGELVLGQWQRILLAEMDGPRTRTVRVQVTGLARTELRT